MTAECASKIRMHATHTYPNECCGALLGRDERGAAAAVYPRQVLEVLPLPNLRNDSPQNRYSVSVRDVIEAERLADGRGLQVVGWFHSHPDHPAEPSQYDRESAWPWYSYIIVSVRGGLAAEMASWRLQDDRQDYWEEQIAIVD
jgi:proteasome lid subunit RPN8/RPN11